MDRLTIRLGPLAAPLEVWCQQHDCSPSEAARRAVAEMLGVDAPSMPIGDVSIGERAKAAAHARWGNRSSGESPV